MTPRHSVHLTQEAHAIGVDGFLVVTPYYSKPPPRGIVAHFEAIAAVTDKPIVAYNIPSRVVNIVEPETFAELARDPERRRRQAGARRPRARPPHRRARLELYAGDDDLILPFLELGGVGGICVHTHVVGPRVKELIRRSEDGRHDARAGARGGARGRLSTSSRRSTRSRSRRR